jgi:hypothetical protein
MYETNPSFTTPSDGNVKIWRYIDIVKFLSLLEKRALYFSRVDLLGDPFEGSLPSTEGQFNLSEYSRERSAEILGVPVDQIPLTPIHDMLRFCCVVGT